GVVASNPWFVVERATPTKRGGDRKVPTEAVGGTADENRRVSSDRQRFDEPQSKGRVVSDGRVAHALVAVAPNEYREPGQRAVLPADAVVQRGGKADVGGTTAEVATLLERRHHGGAEAEHVRFDFGHVLAARIVEGVGADFHRALGPDVRGGNRHQGDDERGEMAFAKERSHRALRCSTA